MHDTFLIERLYEGIKSLCTEKDIQQVDKIVIEVNTDSHVNDKSLQDIFISRQCELITENTSIIIERTELEPLVAVIKEVEGQ
ncbi:MAG: hypothetical protein QM214_06850 [Bacillota bacterium]|jgi:Zn finger protein HypA/HybF involved in hydrogenase expression|nr:hypothetical protein [Bacillota bacterium]HHU43434.1 hypothetical protein [Clostridiales bacterium]